MISLGLAQACQITVCVVYLLVLQGPLEYGTTLTTARFVCPREHTPVRVWWRCTVMDSGELCVMMGLVKLKQTLYASNWDTLELHDMTT